MIIVKFYMISLSNAASHQVERLQYFFLQKPHGNRETQFLKCVHRNTKSCHLYSFCQHYTVTTSVSGRRIPLSLKTLSQSPLIPQKLQFIAESSSPSLLSLNPDHVNKNRSLLNKERSRDAVPTLSSSRRQSDPHIRDAKASSHGAFKSLR